MAAARARDSKAAKKRPIAHVRLREQRRPADNAYVGSESESAEKKQSGVQLAGAVERCGDIYAAPASGTGYSA